MSPPGCLPSPAQVQQNTGYRKRGFFYIKWNLSETSFIAADLIPSDLSCTQPSARIVGGTTVKVFYFLAKCQKFWLFRSEIRIQSQIENHAKATHHHLQQQIWELLVLHWMVSQFLIHMIQSAVMLAHMNLQSGIRLPHIRLKPRFLIWSADMPTRLSDNNYPSWSFRFMLCSPKWS